MQKLMKNSENFKKHTTSNPLKRRMIDIFTDTLNGLIMKIKPNKSFSILDVGCGEDFVASVLTEAFPEATKTGIDSSDDALSIALRKDSVCYLREDIYMLPLDNSRIDIVLCSEVLEHLRSPQDALIELDRVSESWVFCTVPNEPWFCIGNLFSLNNVTRLGNPPDHINHYTKGQFKNFVTAVTGYEAHALSAFPWSLVIYNKGTC
jgi:ubiquinone/menaquinone biosynthesis C-methylase UbiE